MRGMAEPLRATEGYMQSLDDYLPVAWGSWGADPARPQVSLGYGSCGGIVLYGPREAALGHFIPRGRSAPDAFVGEQEEWLGRGTTRAFIAGLPSVVDDLVRACTRAGLPPGAIATREYAVRQGRRDMLLIPGRSVLVVTAGDTLHYHLGERLF